jgi:hypothetical protein
VVNWALAGSYQTSQRMSDSLSDMRRNAIGRLGRLGN